MRKLFRRIRAWYLMRKMDRYMWNTMTWVSGPWRTRRKGIPAWRFYRNALTYRKYRLGPWGRGLAEDSLSDAPPSKFPIPLYGPYQCSKCGASGQTPITIHHYGNCSERRTGER